MAHELQIDIVSAFPQMLEGVFGYSIIQRAVDKGKVVLRTHDLRDYTTDKHRKIDDTPCGGGGGMILMADPFFRCLEELLGLPQIDGTSHVRDHIDADTEIILLAPYGKLYDQSTAVELSLKKRIVLLCGHYKGIDQRVADKLVTRVVSCGDYVCSGGEYPAIVITDTLVRLIPGVLGNAESALGDSFQDGLIDCAYYTRPDEYRGMQVPQVLLSGNHAEIEKWRNEQKIENTRIWREKLLNQSKKT